MRRAGLDPQAQDAHRIKQFSGLRLNYLYSLYDALVSIAVPADKARAVVDAMEHDMGTTLATKPDLENLRLASKQDLESLRLTNKQDLELLRRDMESGFAVLRRDMESGFALLDHKIDSVKSQLELKIDAQEFRMTVKLGSMMVVGFGLLAALRAWT
jgi:hypothetical protein